MITLNELCKTYPGRSRPAVDKLTLQIRRGEIFGLLGQNGAGKTTTIKMLTLQIKPSSGKILFNGQSVAGNELAIKNQIGIVPQHLNFDQELSVWENLELHGRLYHINKADRRRRIDELLEYVQLTGVRNDSVKKLSGGMKRRLLIIRALIHRPQILFMDEPTVALDVQIRRQIWQLISQLKAQGVTVVLTTHYIEEAQALCDRVAIMLSGQLKALDSPKHLCEIYGKVSLEDVFLHIHYDD